MNMTRAAIISNVSLAKRCLSTSSICHSEKQVSLYKGMKSKEFIRQQEMANRQNLVDAYIQVDSPLDVTPITGVPEEHFKTRRVRIFKQAKNSMQSATFDTQNWKIEFETRDRWENPLMGWGSSGDPLSNMIVQFSDVEDAIAFCQKNGWAFHVDDPQIARKPKLKSYAENFAWNKRTRIGSK